MVEDINKFDNNDGVAYSLLDAFVTERQWRDVLNINFEMSRIKKQEIIDFVNEYYTNGYSIVYKRTGEDTKQDKIEKPSITEVELNRDKSSQFVIDILEEETDSIHPVYLNFDKDIDRGKVGKADLLYKLNDKNQLFTLYYVVDMGKLNNKKLPFALEYLQYLGTDKFTASELSMKFYKLACNFGISTGEKRSYVYLNGPQQNFNEALALFEDLLLNAKPDASALKDYVGRILKSRSDAKLNKRSVSSALSTYVLYGKVNPRTYTLSNAELNAMTASELVALIKNLCTHKHQIMYFGPESKSNIETALIAKHKMPTDFIATPAAYEFKPLTYSANTVFFTHFEMVQAEINWRSGAQVFDINKMPSIRAFNEYFGGGMSSVVFQEIRESRALAYSTYSVYSQASEKGKFDVALAYVGTQADKLNDAITAMNELLNNMPSNEESFNQAKQSILSSIEAERIIKGDVFFSYLGALDMGINYDYRKMLYEAIQKITFNDVKAFQEQNIKGRKWAIAVVGSKDKIKESDLKKYGELKLVTLEEIFGY
jgi:predicted Zn-dependent peptidase